MKNEFNYKNGNYIHINDDKFILKKILISNIYVILYIYVYTYKRDFPKLESLLIYFKDIASISNKFSFTIPWDLPTGLTVKNNLELKKF